MNPFNNPVNFHNDEIPGLNFIAIDFETATGKRDSACAVGWVEVADGVIIEKRYQLIRPQLMEFNPIVVRIHGIRPEDVKDSPTFDVLWTELGPKLQGKKIIAHNAASFEISVLKASLALYNIPQPDFDFGCTMQAARSLDLPASLDKMCQHFSIDINHHNALSDAEACARVAIFLYKQFESFLIFDADRSLRRPNERGTTSNTTKNYFRTIFSQSAELEGLDWLDIGSMKNYSIEGKTVIITGVFEQYPDREELGRLLINKGAKIGSAISGKTDVILVGSNAGPSKINKVRDLISKGKSIDLIHEEDITALL